MNIVDAMIQENPKIRTRSQKDEPGGIMLDEGSPPSTCRVYGDNEFGFRR